MRLNLLLPAMRLACPVALALALAAPIALATEATGPAVAVGPAAATAAASAPATEARFDILEFVVEGDSVLGAAAIERAVYPFLGLQRSLADAEGARRALEQAYQAAGFLSVAVQLPPQQLGADGALRLVVLQAVVDRLRVTGAQYTLPSAVVAAVPSLAPGTVPDFHAMQDDLGRLARSSAHRELTPVLAAGHAPNTLDVELKLQERLPLGGSLELNNKQSQNTRAGRLEAALQIDNLLQRGVGLGANWFYAPKRPSDANVLSLLLHLPLGGEGDRLFLTLLRSDSDTPTPLGGATVSRGETWRARWRDALPGWDGASQALTWGLTLRHLRDANVDVAGSTTTPPALRYPSFSAGYELDASDWGGQRGRQSRLSAELSVSLRGLSRRAVDCLGTPREQFACKREGARPDFQVLALKLSHREPLGAWALLARLQGQITDAPLVSAEQMVAGGSGSVRGYFDGEQAGDIGLQGGLELQAPAWRPAEGLELRATVFAEAARLQRLEPLPGEAAHTSLASAGLGLNLAARSGLWASLSWARVLQPTWQTGAAGLRLPTSGSAAGRGSRVDVSLRQSF